MKSGKKERILKVLESSETILSPKIIAQKAKVKSSTARYYLRELLKEGKIIQPFRGYYANKTRYGMGVSPVLLHNVILTCEGLDWLDFSDDIVRWVGGVKVRVQFGKKRRKVTVRISCDDGMDRNTVLLAMDKAWSIIKERTGKEVDEGWLWEFRTNEVHRDVFGVRIDVNSKKGSFCYTRKGLFGLIERIYQKDKDRVRIEHKVSRKMTLDELTTLIHRGIDGYNYQQSVYALLKRIEALADTVKFQNRTIYDQKEELGELRNILVELTKVSANQVETLETFKVAMDEHLAMIQMIQKQVEASARLMDQIREATVALREAVEELRKSRRKPRRAKPKEKPKPKKKGVFGKLSEWWKQGYQE